MDIERAKSLQQEFAEFKRRVDQQRPTHLLEKDVPVGDRFHDLGTRIDSLSGDSIKNALGSTVYEELDNGLRLRLESHYIVHGEAPRELRSVIATWMTNGSENLATEVLFAKGLRNEEEARRTLGLIEESVSVVEKKRATKAAKVRT